MQYDEFVKGGGDMNPKDFLSEEDFADVFEQLKSLDAPDEADSESFVSDEEKASQRRFEEIIMKHRQDPVVEFHRE